MDLNRLAALIKTAKFGSINMAAEELSYTQSGLTYIINTVEKELGLKVISRSHNGITLTDDGKAIFPSLEALVESGDELEHQIDRILRTHRQTIRIGAYSSLMVDWLPSVLLAYRGIHPDVEFNIRTGVLNLDQSLKKDLIDLAICERFLMLDATWHYLADDEMCAAIHKSLPLAKEEVITLEMLADYPVVLPSLLSKNVIGETLCKKQIVYPNQTDLVTEDGSITLKFVSRIKAVSFVSSLYAPECPKDVVLKSFTPPMIRKIGYAVNDAQLSNKNVSAFVQYLRKQKLHKPID